MGDAENSVNDIVPRLTNISPGISLLEPQSRRGYGPGLIILVPKVEGSSASENCEIRDGVPSALMKWSEESYAVIEIRSEALRQGGDVLKDALDTLSSCGTCEPKDQVGLVAYDPHLWTQLLPSLPSHPSIVGAVTYTDAIAASLPTSPIPTVQHIAGNPATKLPRSPTLTAYDYRTATSHLFATPFNPAFHYANEAVSHTRSLTFLKKLMNGPFFDLEAIWDEHCYYEFGDRSVEKTMATMVAEPYVNHIPTMTGGIGRKALTYFYANSFIHSNPPDAELELISRTVGIDRVVDEFLFKCTHTQEVPWLVPGIPPTGRSLVMPFTAIVNIRGDRLYHEHIAWDQANVLIQLGLLPKYLPWPYAPPTQNDGEQGVNGMANGNMTAHKCEFRVPAGGLENAEKMRDKNCLESNKMFEYTLRPARSQD